MRTGALGVFCVEKQRERLGERNSQVIKICQKSGLSEYVFTRHEGHRRNESDICHLIFIALRVDKHIQKALCVNWHFGRPMEINFLRIF